MKDNLLGENIRCRLCEDNNIHEIYSGPIRSGGIGSEFKDGYKVFQCGSCDFAFLNKFPEDIQNFYESNSYRENFDYQIDIKSMQNKFDPDLKGRIGRIGIENLRKKIVADFGAGPGIFIDSITSVADKTIVVEPSQIYRKYLLGRGHECYSYADEMLSIYAHQIDVAVSFDTIEHIPDFREFSSQIYNSLKPEGLFYLSMPNLDDLVRAICPSDYEPFYFQIAHINYFNKKTSTRLLSEIGFKDIQVDYIHKYDIENIFQWIKYGKPGSFKSKIKFDRIFHTHFNAEIERLGVASHLFITAKK